MSDITDEDRYKSDFGKVLYRNFLRRGGRKLITQKELAEKSGVGESVIARMVSRGTFPKGETLYDDLYKIFNVLHKLVGDISVDQAEELLTTIPEEYISTELRHKLLAALIKERIIKQEYWTQWGTRLIGREEDIKAIYAHLEEMQQPEKRGQPFILWGVPGVGKSELAHQIATLPQTREYFPQVCQVIQLTRKELIGNVCKMLDKQLELIGKDTRENTLIILDNYELIENPLVASGELYKYLRDEKHLNVTILATSTIRISDAIYPVGSLETDDAVQLFLQSARARKPDFILTEDNAHEVAEICRALEGLPLGVVIAGSFAGNISVDWLYEKLSSIQNLTDKQRERERLGHISVNALIDLSYELLGEDTEQGKQLQALFRRLGVFARPCSIKAAAIGCNLDDLPDYTTDEGQAAFLSLAFTLYNFSLVTVENGWIQLAHNTLRTYAIRKLEDEEKKKVQYQFIVYYQHGTGTFWPDEKIAGGGRDRIRGYGFSGRVNSAREWTREMEGELHLVYIKKEIARLLGEERERVFATIAPIAELLELDIEDYDERDADPPRHWFQMLWIDLFQTKTQDISVFPALYRAHSYRSIKTMLKMRGVKGWKLTWEGERYLALYSKANNEAIQRASSQFPLFQYPPSDLISLNTIKYLLRPPPETLQFGVMPDEVDCVDIQEMKARFASEWASRDAIAKQIEQEEEEQEEEEMKVRCLELAAPFLVFIYGVIIYTIIDFLPQNAEIFKIIIGCIFGGGPILLFFGYYFRTLRKEGSEDTRH